MTTHILGWALIIGGVAIILCVVVAFLVRKIEVEHERSPEEEP